MNDSEQKVHDDIKKHGCHVMGVFEDEEYPSFSYSIGMEESVSSPEIIVVGLKHSLAQSIINNYHSRIKNGEVFGVGKKYPGFLGGFEVCFIEISNENREELLCWADWYYERKPFRALQMVYPNTSGVWPWEEEASESFLWWQRILNENGKLSESI